MARRRNVAELGDLGLPATLLADRPKGDQIREMLESLVTRLDPGSPLPSERHLAETFGVARMTVRNEIRQLAADGVLVIRRGSGAYVPESPHPSMPAGYSFSREMRRRGHQPGSVVLEHNVLLVTARLAALLETPAGSSALRVVRLRTADGVAVGVERTTVSLARFPGLQDVDLTDVSLYDTLRDRYGVEPSSVAARATAVNPSDEEAELLGITVNDPCLVLDSLQRDRDGLVIEAGRSIYRGDQYDVDLSYRAAR